MAAGLESLRRQFAGCTVPARTVRTAVETSTRFRGFSPEVAVHLHSPPPNPAPRDCRLAVPLLSRPRVLPADMESDPGAQARGAPRSVANVTALRAISVSITTIDTNTTTLAQRFRSAQELAKVLADIDEGDVGARRVCSGHDAPLLLVALMNEAGESNAQRRVPLLTCLASLVRFIGPEELKDQRLWMLLQRMLFQSDATSVHHALAAIAAITRQEECLAFVCGTPMAKRLQQALGSLAAAEHSATAALAQQVSSRLAAAAAAAAIDSKSPPAAAAPSRRIGLPGFGRRRSASEQQPQPGPAPAAPPTRLEQVLPIGEAGDTESGGGPEQRSIGEEAGAGSAAELQRAAAIEELKRWRGSMRGRLGTFKGRSRSRSGDTILDPDQGSAALTPDTIERSPLGGDRGDAALPKPALRVATRPSCEDIALPPDGGLPDAAALDGAGEEAPGDPAEGGGPTDSDFELDEPSPVGMRAARASPDGTSRLSPSGPSQPSPLNRRPSLGNTVPPAESAEAIANTLALLEQAGPAGDCAGLSAADRRRARRNRFEVAG